MKNPQTTPKLGISTLFIPLTFDKNSHVIGHKNFIFMKCVFLKTNIYIYVHVYHNSLPIFIWIKKNNKLLGPLDPYHPITPRSIRGSVDPNILLMEMARQACGLQVIFGLTRTGYPRKPTRLMFLNRFFQLVGLLS